MLSKVCRVLGYKRNLLICAYFEALVSPNVHLDINKGSVIFAPLERVPRIGVLIVKTVWGSTVREEDHHLMD
jgi:hypothetical protein